MDWLKKNYDRFALLLLAVALLASSVGVICLRTAFPERFAPVLEQVAHGTKVTTLETDALDRARESLEKPASWAARPNLLFVSRKYVSKREDASAQPVLVDPFDARSAPLHPPIPNEWFLRNNLEDRILDADVLDQDPDKDGFTNMDEYRGGTDPQDPQSHPPYLTKLRLKRFVKIPFRLKFEAYDDEGNFQINTVDVHQPTQFVQLGQIIVGTKFKAVKFEKKSRENPRTGVDTDVSELTVEHIETGLKIALVVRTEVDSPDQYARFVFHWDNTEFSVKKGQKFTLKPEPGVEYKLIDIQENEAQIMDVKNEGDPIKISRQE